jgi:hypothetical protein
VPALLDRLDAAEAAIDRYRRDVNTLVTERTALTEAARAVTARRFCGCAVYDGHAPDCPVGALAALLTEVER